MIVEIHTVKKAGIINQFVTHSSVFYDGGETINGENLVQDMADCFLTLLCDTVVTVMGFNDGVQMCREKGQILDDFRTRKIKRRAYHCRSRSAK